MPDNYCETHDIDYSSITGYDHCPLCRERERIDRAEMEMLERRSDPDMHPTVDAPRR